MKRKRIETIIRDKQSVLLIRFENIVPSNHVRNLGKIPICNALPKSRYAVPLF